MWYLHITLHGQETLVDTVGCCGKVAHMFKAKVTEAETIVRASASSTFANAPEKLDINMCEAGIPDTRFTLHR